MNNKDEKNNFHQLEKENENSSINILLNKIFLISKVDSNLIPFLRNNCGEDLKNIFNKPPENISNDLLISFINYKINIIKEIKKIISNRYEIIHIINEYLLKYEISPFKYFIDLYLKYTFFQYNNKNNLNINSEEIIKNLKEIIIWFIKCGLLNKDIIDYIFQKISKMQLEKKLTIDSINIYIPLLRILYGENKLNIKRELIAKNYIYLFNRKTSIIKTNISPSNTIQVRNGICIILWFYLPEYCNEKEKTKGTICQILSNDLQKIDFIINNDYDIELKYNTQILLKEQIGHKFHIKNNIWTQLKIQFTNNKIKLFLCQKNDNNSEIKYDIKTYIINNQNKINNINKNENINCFENIKCNNFIISYLNFFLGYEGLVGTILFFINSNNNIQDGIPFKSISGLQNNKVNKFLNEINLKNIYFIIAPSLYCFEDNKFIDTTNNINAELSIEKNDNNLNLNSVINIHNYTKNIFYLGGSYILLPLFEILYKLSNEFDNKNLNMNKSINNYEYMICVILKKLFKLLELIFINKKKNCIEAYKSSHHFFSSLQLFLENIDEKYFNGEIYYKFEKNKSKKEEENYLILSLLNIGKYFYKIKNKKILDSNEKNGFFTNILFYPSILMKFNSIQQNIIFSFFDKIKKENNLFKNVDYKNYFISFEKICNLLILFSEKYIDDYIPSNLKSIIKLLFEDINTNDNERENLFLLYNNHLISDKVFINIMEIFIIYFDININRKKSNKIITNENIKNNIKDEEPIINMRNNSIKYFFYSSNYFIENLLYILLSKNLYIKKLIINFLRILTNEYNSIFEEYFSFVNECNKNYKIKRINKKDFLYFIKENIIINDINQKILNEFEKDIKLKKVNDKNNKNILRRLSFENIINWKKLDYNENLKIKKRKSFEIHLAKNKKKKMINLTKIQKKKKRENKKINYFNKKRSNSFEKNNITKKYKFKNSEEEKINIDNIEFNSKSSNLIHKKKSKSCLNLNIDLINEEYESNILKFKDKTKKLAKHCINYTLGLENNKSCENHNIFGYKNLNLENIENNKNENIKVLSKNEKKNKNITNIKKSKKENEKVDKRKNKNKNFSKIKNDLNINNINKIRESDQKLDLDEDVNINCDISIILYDWLIQIKSNKNKTNNNLSKKSETIEFINQILNYIAKFLSNTIELEVIYRTLLIFLGQKSLEKSDNNKTKYNYNYLKLLSYFSKSHTFRQLLEEIIIDSYLGFNDEEKIAKKYTFNQNNSKLKTKSTKKDLFEKIFNLTKELLIDIYLYKHNNSRNYIIYEIFNIILKKYNGFQKKSNDIFYKLLIFIKDFFNEIINKYHNILNDNNDNENNSFNSDNSNNINNRNNSENKIDLINTKIFKHYIYLFTLFFEASIIFKNYPKYIIKKNFKSEKNLSLSFPNFIKEGIIFNIDSDINKIDNWIFYDEYKKILEDLKEIYDLKNIFKELKISTIILDKTDEIYLLDIEVIHKLVNELIFKKETKGKYKNNIELLFFYYNQSGYFNNFPLINIFSLYKCILLNYENNVENNKNLIQLLNDIQSYIIFIILVSGNIKKDDTFSDENLNYEEIQEIIYQNLLFLIRNIIYKYTKNIENKRDNKKNEINTNNINDSEENEEENNYINEDEEEYESYFICILNNIISILGFIYTKSKDNQNNSSSFLGWKKSKKINDISNTGVNKLIEYYINIYNSFFNIDNLIYFSNNNNIDSNFLIIQQKKNLYFNLVKNVADKSNFELFNYKIFKSICLGREHEIKKKMKLLLKSNQENNKAKHKKGTNKRYKNLLIKINNLKLDENNNKLIEETKDEIFKIKNYRKIKKYLYSFNNSFSNLNVFYGNNKNLFLTYKITNYLSNDKTRKLIIPVLDFDYYLPNFRKFKNINGKMFKKNISDKIYKIDLRIINKERLIITPDINNNSYYLYNDICLIKTTHHIRGKLFYKTEKQILKKSHSFYLYFTIEKNISKEYLLANCPDYDSINETCFGSLFRNNINQKDYELYLSIKSSDINFIFFRKYCYRNNAIEIFLNNHKSYYFKFKNTNDRDNFIEKLINILNQISSNKKLFKNIKSIDENNKSIILGYYKDIDNNKDYKSINEIKDLWKNNKISTLEYIMWINIYGNRSFRDVAQYPVLPWILNDYNLNNIESIVNLNCFRNFNLPMGMMALDEKSIQRKEGYIEGYKLMVNDISEDINVKKPNVIDDNEADDLKISTNKSDDLLKDSDDDNSSVKSMNNEKENNLKIPSYKYDLEKLYYNTNIEYERIPYFFGTHYSNPMYVSHFLTRLFPYSFNLIEIQGDGFDCAERLFFSVRNAFYSSTREKCDLRELIPEFFTLPEMFLNINNLNFGKTEDKNYIYNMKNIINKKEEEEEDNNDNIINTTSNGEELKKDNLQINDVSLPPWTKQNPYYFIQIMRELFEGGIELNKNNDKLININPWIDLIFGYYQRGIKAQNKGNLFLPSSYDGVLEHRIKEENILKNRNENEYMIRYFEIGVTPTKVFEKKCKDKKKDFNYQITFIKNNTALNLNKIDSINLQIKTKIIYIENIYLENNKLLLIDKNFIGHNIIIQQNDSLNNSNENQIIDEDISNNINYSSKENQTLKDFPLVEIKGKNIGYKLIIKSIFKQLLFIVTGYYDGSLYLINTTKKINKRSGYNISSELNSKENNKLQTFGNQLITSLEISKDEKYMVCGNKKGTLIIYSLNYSSFLENKKYIELLKIFNSHNNYRINSISINNNLFLFSDCSYDGYINLYSYPNINLVNSIFINDNKMKKNEIDYVFLSSQPLPVISLYSNKKCSFKTYSINGHNLNYDPNDLLLLKEIEMPLYNNDSMINPILFTDYKFNDYLAYIFKYNFVLIRKFPEMKCHLKISLNNNNCLSKIIISNDLKNLYIYEENENNIYIVNNIIHIKDNNENIIDSNSLRNKK